MAKVHLVSVHGSGAGNTYDPNLHYALIDLKKSAAIDPFHVHSATENPEEADIILFVEMGTCGMFAEVVRAHPLFRKHREKCFLYDWSDYTWPVLPGLYASLHKQDASPEQARSSFYLMPENTCIQHRPATGKEKYLAAFVGSFNTHAMRNEFLKYGRDDIFLQDSSKESYRIRYHGTPEEKLAFWQRYADSITNASFSLCPRGRGPGSIRLFESMKSGRACIILSDDWVPVEGVAWDSFSVRMPEADVARVPEVMEKLRDQAPEMGMRARQEWENWFSEPVRFHRIASLCVEMKEEQKKYGPLHRLRFYKYIAYPRNWRSYIRSKMILYRRTKTIYW